MATYIQLSPDPYSKNKDELTGTGKPQLIDSINSSRFAHVRRPTTGTQTKPDTYATLEVKTKTGQNLLLYDAGGSIEREGLAFSARYSNFLIQSIQEQRAEKHQMMETFGPTYIFFFGPRPVMLGVSGQLLNSADFNWKAEFKRNYELFLRGTQCVTNATTVYLSYDDYVVRGYILTANFDDTAEVNELCNFNFQMVVAGDINLSAVGDPTFPIAQTVDFSTAANLTGTSKSLFDDTFQGTEDLSSITGVSYGKLSDNNDEYIERKQSSVQPADSAISAIENQYSSVEDVDQALQKVFDDAGITSAIKDGQVERSDEMIDAIKDKQFKTMNINQPATKGIQTQDIQAGDIFDSAKDSGIEGRIGRA